MADKRIKNLTAITAATISDSDYVAVDDVSVGETTKKILASDLKEYVNNGYTINRALVSGATGIVEESDTTADELEGLHGRANNVALITNGSGIAIDADTSDDELNALHGLGNNLVVGTGATGLIEAYSVTKTEIEALHSSGNDSTSYTALSNADGEVRGLKQGVTNNSKQTLVASASLAIGNSGVIYLNTSGGNLAYTLPILANNTAGVPFIFALETFGLGSSVTITTNAADAGFIEADGTTGTSLRLDALDEYVYIVGSPLPTTRWMILGGVYTLS